MKRTNTHFYKVGACMMHVSNSYRIRKRSEQRSWEVEFTDAKGVWQSTGTKNIEEVESAVSRILCNIGKQTITGMKFSDFAKDFFDRDDEKSIRKRYERMEKNRSNEWFVARTGFLNNYLIPFFGNMQMSNITDVMIEDWYMDLISIRDGKPLSPGTKLMILDCLSTIMKEAKRKKLIDANPCDTVEKISKTTQEKQPFSVEEIRRLFPDDRMKLLFIWEDFMWALYYSIMVDTGFRASEIAGLKVSDIRNDGGLYTECSVYRRTLRDKIKTSDKGKNYKVGTLSDYTMELLRDYKATYGLKGDDFLFKTRDNGFVYNKISNIKLERACINAGVDRGNRTQHCFRHSFDTYMLKRCDGNILNQDDVRELMAHTGYRPEYDHRTSDDIIDRIMKVKPIIDSIRHQA